MNAAVFRTCSLTAWALVSLVPASSGEESGPALVDGVPAVREDDSPTEPVALDLWIVTLRTKDTADDDQLKPIISRVRNLPASIGSREDAQRLLNRLQEQGVVRRLQMFRVSTLNGNEAAIMCGERVAVPTGVTMTDGGQTYNIQYQQIGTALRLTPKILNENEIRVDVKYERSKLAKSEDAFIARPANGESVAATNVPSVSVSARAMMASGRATVIALLSDSDSEAADLLILSVTTVKAPPTEASKVGG